MRKNLSFRDVIQSEPYSSNLSPQERDRISEAESRIRPQKIDLDHLLNPTPLSAIPQAREFMQKGQSIIFANAGYSNNEDPDHKIRLNREQDKGKTENFEEVSLDELFEDLRASLNRERTFVSYERRTRIAMDALPPAPMQKIKPENVKPICEPKEPDDLILPTPEIYSSEVETEFSNHTAVPALSSNLNCPPNPIPTTSVSLLKPEVEEEIKLLPSDILTSNATDAVPAVKEKRKVSPKPSINSPSNELKEIDPNSPEGIKISFFELLKAEDIAAALTLARKHFKTDFLREIHRAVIWAFENSNPVLANSILKTFTKAQTRMFMKSLKREKYPLECD